MIISASRRTDIPAFYTAWFMNRIREGYCTVPNPFNAKQVSRISLRPGDVDVIVFWTRYAAPLLPYLDELDQRGFRYCFLYTLMGNPRKLEPRAPRHEKSIETFLRLSDRVGKEKVVWRYDPIFFTSLTGPDFHGETFEQIAQKLKGHTQKCIISVVNFYRKTAGRMRQLEKNGMRMNEPTEEAFKELMRYLFLKASENHMTIQTCAEGDVDRFQPILPGKCIDNRLIHDVFNLPVTTRKDPSQRPACGCVASRDIGMYDTCRFGCIYCYATSSFERAKARYRSHNPRSPSLSGRFEANVSGESTG